MAIASTIPRAALVTGGAKRIGRALALELAEAGFAVAVHYNGSAEDAAAVVRAIESRGGKGVALGADLSNEAETSKLVEAATRALGPLGCLVNNASVFEHDTLVDADRAAWDRHMETNLRAPYVLTQGFARALPETAEGVIVNLIDERVWNLTPFFSTYTLSKAGLWALTQTAALALAPRIRVNAIGPGPALASSRQSAEQFDRQCAEMPLQRGTSPEEIAAALRFILGAPSMTGQMLALDGGQHLAWSQARGTTPEE